MVAVMMMMMMMHSRALLNSGPQALGQPQRAVHHQHCINSQFHTHLHRNTYTMRIRSSLFVFLWMEDGGQSVEQVPHVKQHWTMQSPLTHILPMAAVATQQFTNACEKCVQFNKMGQSGKLFQNCAKIQSLINLAGKCAKVLQMTQTYNFWMHRMVSVFHTVRIYLI